MPGSSFRKLKKDSPLVNKLLTEEWWRYLVSLSHKDQDINIQIRRDAINVYSKMGNLLRIGLQKGKVTCDVHYKYLLSFRKSPYVKITPNAGCLSVGDNACTAVKDILSEESLRVIKQNIAIYAGEEKTIQSKLVEYNKNTILDVEVGFSGDDANEGEGLRIDFANYDKKHQKIIFIELKQIFDNRLYNDEINHQIEKYYTFAKSNSKQIIEAYKDCLETKKKLGIIRKTDDLYTTAINALEPKPILVIAAYNQKMIDALKETILKGINKNHLTGIYFFGNYTDLNIGSGRNKILFP